MLNGMNTLCGLRGDRIRKLRLNIGLTQVEMVERVRALVGAVNQSHLSQVERGDRGLASETLAAVAVVLETSTDYLVGLTDDPTQHGNMEDQVIIVESDPALREYLQRLLSDVERLPSDKRAEYYRTMEMLLRGMSPTRAD